jgi:phage terminase large subunit-like protein
MSDSEMFQIESIAYDRWNSSQLIIELSEQGAEMRKIGQGFASLSAPTKQIETEIVSGKVTHDGNPVMAWMMSNVDLRTDPAGNIKPDKDKSNEKIDGVVAMVMARAEAMDKEAEGGSYLDDEEMFFV